MSKTTLDLVSLTKAKLGITSNARDVYIGSLVEGIKQELEDFNGIKYETNDKPLDMYISELASWRYQNAGNPSMPRHMQLWLNNLIVRGMKHEASKENI